MTSNSPPKILGGRYHLQEKIGKGGMAIVYQATDIVLNRIVAIKIMLPNVAAMLGQERLIRESHALARLTHSHIMQVFDAGSSDSWQYLVLEYIAGTSLHDLIENHEAVTLPHILAMMDEILSALEYAHQQGIIHRDIKPENIMMQPDGHIKVMDFGLALSLEEPRLTTDDTLVGTVFYMAPEIFDGGHYTERSDLYAVGAVCYEIVTGSPPFVADTILGVANLVLNGQFIAPKSANPTIPEMLDAFIVRLLERNPSKRYGSAQDARKALALIALHDEIPSVTNLTETHPSTRLERILRTSSQQIVSEELDAEVIHTPLDSAESQALVVFAVQEDLMQSLEGERRRISGMVQENITGQLGLLLSQIAIYEQTFANQPQFKMAIGVLSTLLRQVIQQARDIESSLYSPVLESLGLEPALEMLCSQEMRIHGVHIALRLQRLRERMPAHIELLLYRATQELIDGAVRQSFASQLRIVLEKQSDGIVYLFNHNGTSTNDNRLHLTRARIESLGGFFSHDVARPQDHEIRIHFPIETPPDLTERELEVLQLIAEGLTNKEIAQMLFISIRTVKFHLDNVYSKLGIRSRTEAAIFAIRRGIVRKPPVLKDSP